MVRFLYLFLYDVVELSDGQVLVFVLILWCLFIAGFAISHRARGLEDRQL